MLADYLRSPPRTKKMQPYVETAFAVLCLAVLNVVFAPGRPGFLDVEPHPLLIVVLLAAGRNGLVPGLFAATLSLAVLGGVYYQAYVVPDLTVLLQDTGGIPAASFFLVAIFAGELRDSTLRKYSQVVEEHDAVCGKLDRLAQAYTVLQDEKHVLEKGILSERTPLEFLWQLVESMDTVDEKQFMDTVVRLMRESSQAQAVALYIRDDTPHMALAGSIGGAFEPELTAPDAVTARAIESRQVSTVADLPDATLESMSGSKLHIAVPIARALEDEVIEVVLLQEVPLATFSTVRLKSLEVAGRLAGRMAGRIEFYRQALVHNVFDPRVDAVTPFYLAQRGREELERSQHRQLPLSAVVIRIPRYDTVDPRKEMMLLSTLATVVRRHMRPGQVLARASQAGGFVVLLPLETIDEAARISLEVRNEIVDYKLRPYSDGGMLELAAAAVALYPGSETWEDAAQKLAAGGPGGQDPSDGKQVRYA